MSKLYVPAIGDRITLIKPWEFTLYLEHRNVEFARRSGLYDGDSRWSVWNPNNRQQFVTVKCVLEPSTVLECDRIYIKSTSKSAKSIENNYDSISWKVIVNDRPATKQRFWAKLSDCYNLEFDPSTISKYQDRK